MNVAGVDLAPLATNNDGGLRSTDVHFRASTHLPSPSLPILLANTSLGAATILIKNIELSLGALQSLHFIGHTQPDKGAIATGKIFFLSLLYSSSNSCRLVNVQSNA
jgi:hypothetical protein